MLTSLDFLKAGEQWPPRSEKYRLDRYQDNRALFEDDHAEVYKEQFKRIERVIGNFSQVVSYAVLFNYQKLISLKIADLVFGEPPKITVADEKIQKVVDEILVEQEVLNAAYEAAIDVSRYGDGLLLLSNQENMPAVTASSPAHWFPVVDAWNLKQIRFHVFAWAYPLDSEGEKWELKVQIHNPAEPSSCEQHRYSLEGIKGAWKIGREIARPEEALLETKLPVCPVFRVSNVKTTDRLFGIDDYQSIDSIVSELMVRVSQISKVLDKHANPSMSGPEGAMELDNATGEWRFRIGDYYPRRSNDEPDVNYITWDASMDANFKQIEILTNQLYTISEMGSAIFGDVTGKTGEVPSGSALRRLMMSPLAKARRVSNSFDPVLKKLISACAALKGIAVDAKDITITWNDGLPDDEAENANIMAVRTGNRPTISQHTAIRRLDDMSEEEAAAELDEIRADDAAADMGSAPPAETENESFEEKPPEELLPGGGEA